LKRKKSHSKQTGQNSLTRQYSASYSTTLCEDNTITPFKVNCCRNFPPFEHFS